MLKKDAAILTFLNSYWGKIETDHFLTKKERSFSFI